MDNNRYLLMGAIAQPIDNLFQQVGLRQYVDFVVEVDGRPQVVVTTPFPSCYDNNGKINKVCIKGVLKPESLTAARVAMRRSRFVCLPDPETDDDPIIIDLETQVICQRTTIEDERIMKTFSIVDARAFYDYRITLREKLSPKVLGRVQRYIQQNPNPPKGE